MATDELHVGRLPGRMALAARLQLGGTVVAVACVSVSGWMTQPAHRVWVVATPVLIVAVLLSVASVDTWLDPVGGRLRHRRAWVSHWEVRWVDAQLVRFRRHAQGLVLLEVKGTGWRRIWVPLASVSGDRGLRSQPLGVLRMLAHEIRRCAPPQHHAVADELDAQADHLERTRDLGSSPLVQHHFLGR